MLVLGGVVRHGARCSVIVGVPVTVLADAQVDLLLRALRALLTDA
jgi:hypothetical protein